ncbi:hypothetical protein C0995_003335 [Termitomyces sp. Mi166|nr:hypothetical protein C0995_003335 [Termitomyces sp. Mi166\
MSLTITHRKSSTTLAQAFATSVFQQAIEKGVLLPTSLAAPINPIYVWERVLENFGQKPPPVQQLFPEVLECQPPRIIAKTSPPEQTCFIQNLPDHLLLEVFERYLNDDGEGDYKPHYINRKPTLSANLSFTASPITLLSVCKRWKSFYDTPSLWTSLAVYKPRSKQVSMIISWLNRSVPKEPSEMTRNPLISLYLYAPSGDEGCDQPAIYSILALFMSPFNAGRMKHLTIKLTGDFPISVHTFDAPYLQSVELDFGGTSNAAPIWRSICQREPRVRKVSWRLIFLPLVTATGNVPAANVILGQFQDRSYLFDLDIAITLPPEDALAILSEDNHNAEQQADGLCGLRALRERDIVYRNVNRLVKAGCDSINIVISGPIELPRLRHLKVEAHGRDATPLLDHLTVLSLSSPEIIHCANGSSHPSTDGNISLLSTISVTSHLHIPLRSPNDKS